MRNIINPLLSVLLLAGLGVMLGDDPVKIDTLGPRTLRGGHPGGPPLQFRFEEKRVSLSPKGVPSNSAVLEGSVCRDSHGRIRREVLKQNDDQFHFVTIEDPGARTQILLDLSLRMAFVSGPFPQGNKGKDGLDWIFPGANPIDLGKEVVSGIESRHIHLNSPSKSGAGLVDDVWVSDELNIVLQERRLSTQESYNWRAYEVLVHEPPASSFQIPPDFLVTKGNQ